MSSPSTSTISKPHIALFPFMSKGHTIPLLGLARLLIRRSIAVTIFTTPANRPFISHSLPSDADVSIVDLPFPTNVPDVPPGIESTDKLPSMSLFIHFVNGTKLMQPSFERALGNVREEVTCLVSDGFLHWTHHSATKFGIPRLSFYGMSHYAMGLSRSVGENGLLSLHESDDEEFAVPSFPWIKLCRNDFDEPFCHRAPSGPHWDFILESSVATVNGFGVLVNSFRELEKPFADYWARECGPKAWSVGPLCLASPEIVRGPEREKPRWIRWLDEMSAQSLPVLYVAFGSQASIPAAQMREIARGLGGSGTRFLWVVRAREGDAPVADGDFEGRGILVNEWVDQREILGHRSVRGFLSHCGWNSVAEAICAGVPILAWPMMAEQFLNAKFVAEEAKIGLRVATVDGRRKGFVSGESLKGAVAELMEGEKGKMVNENVKRLAEEARRSVAEGGSSWIDLDRLIEETRRAKEINTATSTSTSNGD